MQYALTLMTIRGRITYARRSCSFWGVCNTPLQWLRCNRLRSRVNGQQELHQSRPRCRVIENISATGVAMVFIFQHAVQRQARPVVQVDSLKKVKG